MTLAGMAALARRVADAATVCGWMPEFADYLVVLAKSVINGMTVCDKA